MRTEFFYSTCKGIGLSSSVYLRNTYRTTRTQVTAVRAAVSIFQAGTCIVKNYAIGNITPGGMLEIKEQTLREQFKNQIVANDELLFSFSFLGLDGNADQAFAQEHQINYFAEEGFGFGSLLFDQMPVAEKATPPVVLIAPKIWLSPETEVYLVMATRSEAPQEGLRGLKLGLFDENGSCAHSWETTEVRNSANVLPIRKIFKDLDLSGRAFFNLFGFGNSSSTVLYTIIQDRKTGNLAIEHSLSPHYYFSGDRARVRRDVEGYDWAFQKGNSQC